VNRRSAGNLQDKVTLTYTRPASEVTQLEHIYTLLTVFYPYLLNRGMEENKMNVLW